MLSHNRQSWRTRKNQGQTKIPQGVKNETKTFKKPAETDKERERDKEN